MELIKATANQFGGLVLDKDDLPSDAAEFNERLRYSLDVWRREGFKVGWF